MIESLISSETWPDIECVYWNYRSERSIRKIRPQSIRFGSSLWHRDEQWLLIGWDLDKNEIREFAMKDMTDVSSV
jgi:predicted DNA-binding transcriptional regulator YafY